MTKISILGLGAMGSALAHCLIKSGHVVSVWNRSPEKAAPLVQAGATACETVDDAVAASDLILTCIRGHRDVVGLISGVETPLEGKTICDMSTGDTKDAEELALVLSERGADFMLGMINAYPSGIGSSDASILAVGLSETWDRYGDIIRQLGGKSACVGETPAALAALFAGLFTVRQGFMFGMIYGALVCRKAGIPMQVFSDQMPATLKLVDDYYDLFSRTVPQDDFDTAEATLRVYALAQEDALKTFYSLNAPAEFMELMYEQTKAAWDGGLGEKQLTVLASSMAGR